MLNQKKIHFFQEYSISKTRNIGIIAHIDGGNKLLIIIPILL